MARIIVAGLDMAALDVLTAEIAAEGHDVVCLTSGQDVYDAVLAGPPDLVFLEVALPIFSGYETCAMLRADPEVPKELPVLLFTTPDVDTAALRKAGVTDTLDKAHPAWALRDLLAKHIPPNAMPERP